MSTRPTAASGRPVVDLHAPAAEATDEDTETATTSVPRPAVDGTVLVTGAGGEVGHGLITALHRSGRRIIALDLRAMDPAVAAHCHDTIEGDVTDRDALASLLEHHDVTEVHQLAALLSSTGEKHRLKAHDVNVGGTLNLLTLLDERGERLGRRLTFLFPSSIAVYGLPSLEAKTAAGACDEGAFCEPRTMYGCNKLYGEAVGRYYAEVVAAARPYRAGVDFRCVRFPGLLSADTAPSGGTSDFGPEMIGAARRGEAYQCFVRADSRIPFMTMPDAIDAVLALAAAPETALTRRVYNVSAFSPSAGDFAEAVAERVGPIDVTYVPTPHRQAIVDSWPADLNVEPAKADWGFRPRHGDLAAAMRYLVPGD